MRHVGSSHNMLEEIATDSEKRILQRRLLDGGGKKTRKREKGRMPKGDESKRMRLRSRDGQTSLSPISSMDPDISSIEKLDLVSGAEREKKKEEEEVEEMSSEEIEVKSESVAVAGEEAGGIDSDRPTSSTAAEVPPKVEAEESDVSAQVLKAEADAEAEEGAEAPTPQQLAYACPLCDKRYSRKSSVKKHIVSHFEDAITREANLPADTGENQCPRCSYKGSHRRVRQKREARPAPVKLFHFLLQESFGESSRDGAQPDCSTPE